MQNAIFRTFFLFIMVHCYFFTHAIIDGEDVPLINTQLTPIPPALLFSIKMKNLKLKSIYDLAWIKKLPSIVILLPQPTTICLASAKGTLRKLFNPPKLHPTPSPINKIWCNYLIKKKFKTQKNCPAYFFCSWWKT